MREENSKPEEEEEEEEEEDKQKKTTIKQAIPKHTCSLCDYRTNKKQAGAPLYYDMVLSRQY